MREHLGVECTLNVVGIQKPGQVALNDIAQPIDIDNTVFTGFFERARFVVSQPVQQRGRLQFEQRHLSGGR